MKEIKFRAWSIEQELMIYPSETGWFDKAFKGSYKTLQSIRLDTVLNSLYIKPMQYTGLQDSKGNEIYENDIVQISYMNPLMGEVAEDSYKIETQENGLVKMIHSSGEERRDRYLYLQYKEVEVIGNIYENAELYMDGLAK